MCLVKPSKNTIRSHTNFKMMRKFPHAPGGGSSAWRKNPNFLMAPKQILIDIEKFKNYKNGAECFSRKKFSKQFVWRSCVLFCRRSHYVRLIGILDTFQCFHKYISVIIVDFASRKFPLRWKTASKRSQNVQHGESAKTIILPETKNLQNDCTK